MDGVVVAYHNTARLFGFQYVPLEEMDTAIYGEAGRGDRVFQKCVRLMEELADEIVRVYPEQVRASVFIVCLKSLIHLLSVCEGHFRDTGRR